MSDNIEPVSKKVEVTTTINEKYHCRSCPLQKSACYETLGGFKKECDFFKGHDYGSAIKCSFDNQTPENKALLLSVFIKIKDSER
jgi:hypothetical protein